MKHASGNKELHLAASCGCMESMRNRSWWLLVLLWVCHASGAGATVTGDTATLAAQRAEYAAQAPKTVVQLQAFRRTSSIGLGSAGQATLVDLNPRINAWFLLTLERPGAAAQSYHLENPQPLRQQLQLSQAYPQGLRLVQDGAATDCALWSGPAAATELARARAGLLPYAPLCGGRLYLRNAVRGTYTQIERTTNFLRDHVWQGEQIVSLVRDGFFRDAYMEKGELQVTAAAGPASPDAPAGAALNPAFEGHSIVPGNLGIDLGPDARTLHLGRWYPVADTVGVFVSAIEPRAITLPLLEGDRGRVSALDTVESAALDYLVAFDLDQFDLGFALGTDHPRVGWSARALESTRDASLGGPDGISSIAPLAANGMVSPALAARTVAAFTGGFKREHGAFLYGALAQRNHGSHYGFIEQGTVLSKLQPGLATLYVLEDGSVGMKTWTTADDALLPRMRHARQNGVALIEFDAARGVSSPGALLKQWGAGNWAGSKDQRLRTLRAGACIQQNTQRRYLIYGYFSTATPSAMARVFQAYHCRYAMHLDMNALEHSYLAVYTHRRNQLMVQHLIDGMAVVDRKGKGAVAPRFIGFPDDRDFFYLVRRSPS